ncbi:MAG TPA: ImmA/IrrE family metallo-endopeptidase [Candidatus Saccharimonadales bacterium]|nr:ImmA/IrrE family metallo-endopeptidase [Candidatus Saccharimonadales bacterium]
MSILTEEQKKLLKKYKSNFPVHVGKLAEELGLTVISTTDLPSGMSGSISKEDERYIIYVNSGQSMRRQRFTIAHEIGHFLQHRDFLDTADEILNPAKKIMLGRPDSGSRAPVDTIERQREYEADNFAGELLMPKEIFEDIWLKAESLKDVADYFNVSAMAANVRAALLGLGYFDEINGTHH